LRRAAAPVGASPRLRCHSPAQHTLDVAITCDAFGAARGDVTLLFFSKRKKSDFFFI
jgi:hypothetical protein